MDKSELKQKINEVFESLDYIADNYLLKRKITSKKAGKFYAIYQQLGLLWELLGCLCKHWDGYKNKDDKLSCKICGKVKGTKENYYLLPVRGKNTDTNIV